MSNALAVHAGAVGQSINQSKVIIKPHAHAGKGEAIIPAPPPAGAANPASCNHEVMQAWGAVHESRQH